MKADEYISKRVDDAIAWYDMKAMVFQKMHLRFQMLIMMLSLFVPILLVIPKNIGGVDISLTVNTAATIMSILLAVLIAYQSLRNYRENWALYRATAESLKHEKYLYLTNSGQYADPEHAFDKFVQAIEEKVSKEHAQWSQLHKSGTTFSTEKGSIKDGQAQPSNSADPKRPGR